MRSGYGRSLFEPLLPLILGRDEVFSVLHPTTIRDTYTDYAILLEDELAAKPVSISRVEASAIPFAALTAWRALKSTARITQGQRVLVVSGGGAVSFATIQFAVAAEYHVSTTCGSESIDQGMVAGAEQAVDYTTQGEAASLTDRYGLAIGLPIASAILPKKQIQYRYSHGIEYWWTYMRADAEDLAQIRRLSEVGKLKIPVEKTFSITQVREAHEAKDKRLIPGVSRKILAASARAHTRIPKQSTPFQLPSDDGTYAMKKVLIQNSEQLDLVWEEICVSSLFTHPNLLPLLDHAIIAVKVISLSFDLLLPDLVGGTYYAAVIENCTDFVGRVVVVDVGAGSVEASEMPAYACKLTVVTTIDHLSMKFWFESILPHLLQIRLSVEVPPAVCEDCYKRVMNEFMKQSKVMLRE
ncbi:hypothetical protein ACSBR1_039553 [Camellia fascicularis]